MKKLISAVTSICMAATMVSAVMPLGVNAADSTKGLSLKTFGGASSTISADDIAAGDVTVPCAMYLTETAKDVTSFQYMIGVQAESADPSAPVLKEYQITESYYDSAQSFTTVDGTAFTTDKGVFFAGSVNARGVYTNAGSQYIIATTENQPAIGADYYCIGGSWTGPLTGSYEWMGKTSDAYPVLYFDVTFPQGSKAGDYIIDFYKYDNDAGTAVVPMPQVNGGGEKYAAYGEWSNLDLSGLTITIEGDAPTPETTTTTTTTTPPVTTTTTTTTNQNGDAEATIDLGQYEVSEAEAAAGTTIMGGAVLDSGTNAIAGFDLQFDISELEKAGIGFEYYDYSPAFGNSAVVVNADAMKAVGATLNGSLPMVPDTSVNFLEYDIIVPAGTPNGEYTFTLTYVYLYKEGKSDAAWVTKVIDGVVKVGDSDTPETTTTTTTPPVTTTTTTTTPPATTTTTTTTHDPLTPFYGDSNCDNKVNIADVVVLNKWLNDSSSYNLTEQGKLNANCDLTNDELNADDSDAIIRSIVHLVTLPIE